MNHFDIIDDGDAAEEEVRRIAVRRMFMYSAPALLMADEVDRKYVLFPDLQAVPSVQNRESA